MPLVLRSEKGSQLTFNEMDGNFTYLEELSQTGSFTGSFIGDGSGLTGIPGVTPIATGSFATTGSNQFNGGQSISGSAVISGSLLQGAQSIASGIFSHAEGRFTTASGNYSHAEGQSTKALGQYSHAEGLETQATNLNSHAEGYDTRSTGPYAHAEGWGSIASGTATHAEGTYTTAVGGYSHAEGYATISDGQYSHAEGILTSASADYSHTEGQNTLSSGVGSHAEGFYSIASGNNSHAEGGYFGLDDEIYRGGTASGTGSHAEGAETRASGIVSHAEGFGSWAIGDYSHAEGSYTTASGDYSHAEGFATFAGAGAHSEGENTRASGISSHTEGYYTTASGNHSHAEGLGTIASGNYSHAQGAYNIAISSPSSFIIGNGASNSSRSNLAFASGSQFQITGSLLVSGSARLTGGVTGSSFTGSFVGDGSGLTGIPGVTPIATGSFATTGSNIFVGNQIVTGSLILSSSAAIELTVIGNSVLSGSLDVSGSINTPGSGSFINFVSNPNTMRSIRGNGPGLFNIIEQGNTGITFAVSKITTNDLTGAITSNISGSTIDGNFYDNTTTTSGRGRGARLSGFISGGVVTRIQIETATVSLGQEEYGQPANRQGIGYKAGDTVTIDQSLNQASGSLTITLRPQDIETYLGHDSRLTFDYDNTRTLRVAGDIVTTTNLTIGEDDDTSEFYVSNNGNNSIVAGVGSTAGSDTGGSIVTGYYNTTNYQGTAVFGAWNTASEAGQTVIGLASNTTGIGTGAFIIGNGTEASNKSNLLVAQGSTVQVTGSLLVTGSANIRGGVTGSSFTGSFVGDGSGLTGIPGVTPIDTGSFATTGSNIFVGNQTVTGSLTVSGSITHRGNQTITGSLNVSGSITAPGSGSYRDFVNDPTKFRSIRGNGSGLFNIIEQSDSNISFAVSKITTNDLTGAITSNLSGANNNSYNDLQPTTSGVGRGARLMLTIAGGVVTSVRIFNTPNSNNSYEEDGQPANRQGIGYVAGDTLTLAAGTGGIGGSGNLIITLRPQDIETYLGVDSNFKFNYHESPELQISTNTFGTNIGIGGGIADGIGSIAAGTGTVAAGSTGAAIAVGFRNLASSTATSVFGAYNTGSDAQTVVGIAAITLPGLESAFIIGNGNNASDRSNLLVAAGNEVQVTGSLLVTGSANVNGFVLLPQVSASLNFVDDTAAASGGVPLGGLYRSGSFIQIRLV
jgi:hypothetical protein